MRNIILAALAGAGALAVMTAPAAGWDYPGHRMVGAIADFVLSSQYPAAYDKVQAQLGTSEAGDKRTLSQVAVFPDCAKPGNVPYCGRPSSAEEKAYTGNNKHNGTYHYTDVPIQQAKYLGGSAGTEDYDVVRMINYTVAQLRGKSPSKPDVKLSDTEALWLLAHLVGDIHQPLHVGSIYFDKETCKQARDPTGLAGGTHAVASTVGGNNILLVAPAPAAPPADNFHFFWDGTAVNGAMKAAGLAGAEQDFARLLAGAPPAGWKTDGDPETWAEKWATEILPLARSAHNKLSITYKPDSKPHCRWTTQISAGYSKWASEQARKQIAKAGFRLAAILKAIYQP